MLKFARKESKAALCNPLIKRLEVANRAEACGSGVWDGCRSGSSQNQGARNLAGKGRQVI